jgi:hypothetical protein
MTNGIPVVAYLNGGAPLTIAAIDSALTAAGIGTDIDLENGGEVLSAPEDWEWAKVTCVYVAAMIDRWGADTPSERNPRLASDFVRLYCAHRNGCITEADFQLGRQAAIDRHVRLLATQEPVRALRRGEVDDCEALGLKRAKTKTDKAVQRELGGHTHESVTTTKPEEAFLIRLSDVVPERVTWLWQDYLPAGKLCVLDGDPGIGKSTLAIEFGAVASAANRRWPDGTHCPTGDVIILSAEDGLADTIRPRLDAAEGDPTRVHAIEGVPLRDRDGELILDAEGERVLRPPTLEDIRILEAAIRQTRAVLVIIDVLMAYVPTGKDSHKDQDIRTVLAPLAKLADRTNCTVLLLRHLNKDNRGVPMYRGGGSIAIVGAARAGLLAAPDPEDPDRRVLASVKNNLAPTPPSLAYRLVAAGDYGAARVVWDGTTDYTAHTLLASLEDTGAATAAENWLEDYMMANHVVLKSSDVKKEAAKVGIAERTLQRAASKLKLIVTSEGFPRETFWSWWPTGTHFVVSVTLPGCGSLTAVAHPTGEPANKSNRAAGSERFCVVEPPPRDSHILARLGANGGISAGPTVAPKLRQGNDFWRDCDPPSDPSRAKKEGLGATLAHLCDQQERAENGPVAPKSERPKAKDESNTGATEREIGVETGQQTHCLQCGTPFTARDAADTCCSTECADEYKSGASRGW